MSRRTHALKPVMTAPVDLPGDEAAGILSEAEAMLALGRPARAADVLLPLLLAAAEAGDRAAALAARLLQADPPRARPASEDDMAAALTRLAELVRTQDVQLAALQHLLDHPA